MTRTRRGPVDRHRHRFNTRVDLLELPQVACGTPPAVPHEIVLVDNASRDGSLARSARAFRPVSP